MPFRALKLPVFAVTAALMFNSTAVSQDAPSADQVLATVNGTEITLGHMIVLRAGLPPQYDQVPAQTLFNGILEQLIQQTLLAQSLSGEPSLQSRILIENETRAIAASEVIGRVLETSLKEEDVEAAYAETYLGTNPSTEYSAAHILLETEEHAQQMINQLAEGAEFSALAREFSVGPSGPSGGELGWFGEGVMVAPFFEAVSALEPGEVSEPVKTDFGWHVILLKDTRAKEVPALDEVRLEIENMLRDTALEAFVSDLEANGDVQRTDVTEFDPAALNDTSLLGQ